MIFIYKYNLSNLPFCIRRNSLSTEYWVPSQNRSHFPNVVPNLIHPGWVGIFLYSFPLHHRNGTTPFRWCSLTWWYNDSEIQYIVVTQSEAKSLVNTHVDASEILHFTSFRSGWQTENEIYLHFNTYKLWTKSEFFKTKNPMLSSHVVTTRRADSQAPNRELTMPTRCSSFGSLWNMKRLPCVRSLHADSKNVRSVWSS